MKVYFEVHQEFIIFYKPYNVLKPIWYARYIFHRDTSRHRLVKRWYIRKAWSVSRESESKKCEIPRITGFSFIEL